MASAPSAFSAVCDAHAARAPSARCGPPVEARGPFGQRRGARQKPAAASQRHGRSRAAGVGRTWASGVFVSSSCDQREADAGDGFGVEHGSSRRRKVERSKLEGVTRS